ncbi:hypothetical protein CXG81DRAFT_15692 [Caulochytrium protostelioides]|uniref:PRELI/MSF1 domain-containing protein n=1 Tax=Caulochytrium protostelioides TaxID=1555241 RepID=A0A4V1ITX8_9FUNG|nr:hypothetical protein CXG81DRAFT_15692 [Caulochytrium protostelioides]|eukprot:RKO98607.1 hypothetical protein CXG81DRAFT_15692 [Caulochytrium protostelioides]
MVRVFQQSFDYPYDWATATRAVWQKYPNPFASHVISSDLIDVHHDPATGVLCTVRLFRKMGHVPRWGRLFMQSGSNEAYILEHAYVDARQQTMRTVTQNLSHTKIMVVEETQVYTPAPDAPTARTRVTNKARFISNAGWESIKSRIEGFGLARFHENTQKSAQGLSYVMERLAGTRAAPRLGAVVPPSP